MVCFFYYCSMGNNTTSCKKVNDVSRSVSLTAICIPICLGMNVMLKIINPIGNQEIWNGFVGGLNFFYHLPSIFVGCVIFNIEKHGFINNLAAKNARVTSINIFK